MISKSSARDWLKCSHSALDCSTPSASSSCLSSGTHDPHDVPAAVHDFSAGTSPQPSAIAHFSSPLVTLLHEQIWAESGSAPTPKAPAPAPDPAGAISARGSPGSSAPTIGRSTPYDEASPTSTPPSSVVASSESTNLAYVRFTASLMTTSRQFSVAPIASPKLATSTPNSLSLVDRSASGNSADPSSSRSATTSALVYPGPTRP
ncbi:Uncharacterised protein [Mycobacterium tuberculosis]|nr:Uncharacterised protein [Mycobacterium tuberculosis]